jgi:hypothetical protein
LTLNKYLRFVSKKWGITCHREKRSGVGIGLIGHVSRFSHCF